MGRTGECSVSVQCPHLAPPPCANLAVAFDLSAERRTPGLRYRLHLERLWRHVADRRVQALSIVVRLDVVEDQRAGLLRRRPLTTPCPASRAVATSRAQ